MIKALKGLTTLDEVLADHRTTNRNGGRLGAILLSGHDSDPCFAAALAMRFGGFVDVSSGLPKELGCGRASMPPASVGGWVA